MPMCFDPKGDGAVLHDHLAEQTVVHVEWDRERQCNELDIDYAEAWIDVTDVEPDGSETDSWDVTVYVPEVEEELHVLWRVVERNDRDGRTHARFVTAN